MELKDSWKKLRLNFISYACFFFKFSFSFNLFSQKIRDLEPEGTLKMDLILAKADAALHCISEDKKHEVLSKLRHIKALWEETAIYITHCHR